MAKEENGQKKCPKCGSTDISQSSKSGKLRCNFCRYEFEPEVIKEEEKVSDLEGEKIGKGSAKIDKNFDGILTLKCTSCGAEVVIDTNEVQSARCHWCRNTLSINEKIPNGAVPDMILPFKLTRNEARNHIDKFVGKRKFFAHPKFKEEFTSENVMGVYFPYMVVDMNAKVSLYGEGEHETRMYTVTVGSGDNKHEETRYDADLYEVGRDFDLEIKGLTVESSADKLENSKTKTNNIINSIMPFDTENCVEWDANYLRNYTSEKRDVNVEQLKPLVNEEAMDIGRYAANETVQYYDRGVRWRDEKIDIKGRSWKSAYLPVWLYSYLQKKGEKSMLHYVAVNARTNETMGSVPIHKPKLFFVSAIIEILTLIMAILLVPFFDEDKEWIPYLLLIAGFIYYGHITKKYRNKNARHFHEKETNREIKNLKKLDGFLRHRTGLEESYMIGANNHAVRGKFGSKAIVTESDDTEDENSEDENDSSGSDEE